MAGPTPDPDRRLRIFELDVTAWGWIHLIGGVILVLAGVGVFSGNVLVRTVGVVGERSEVVVANEPAE